MFFSLFNISNAYFSSASRCSLKLHTTAKLLANVLLYHQKLGASFHNVDSTLLNMLCVTFAQYYTWKAVFKPSDKLYFSKLFSKRTRLTHLLLIFASLFIPGRSQGIDLSKKRSSEKAKPRRWTQRKLYLEEYDDEVGDREMYQKESHPRFSMVHKTLPDRGTLKKEMKKSNTSF